MKNKYLVANPMGTILFRCDTMEEVRGAIKSHFQKAKDSYVLLGVNCSEKDYQVIDLDTVPKYIRLQGRMINCGETED